MKKLLSLLALVLIVSQVSAQTKAASDALNAWKKAKAAVEKKDVAPNWLKLSTAYVGCYEAPIKGIWLGAAQMEAKLLLKDQPVLSSEQVEKAGQIFTKDSYIDKELYYSQNGQLTAFVITKPAMEGDALNMALESLDKAAALDTKNALAKDIAATTKGIQDAYYSSGMSYYNVGEYAKASEDFEKSFYVSTRPCIGQIDTAMIYYATITASYAADHDRTLELAKVALDYKYDGKGDLYATIAASHKEKGDTLKAKETLAKGFELYPTNQSVLVALINIYMESNDDPEKIIAIIKVAQQNEPTNASLVYAEGNLYRKLNKYQESIDCFHKSGEMDPTYIFAPFAEGCAYYDWAVEIQNQAQLEMDDAKYNALLEKMEAALNNAAAPFERAFEISQDQEIKVACAEYLKNIYFRQREKSEEGKAKYEKYNSFVENAGN